MPMNYHLETVVDGDRLSRHDGAAGEHAVPGPV